VLCLIRDKQVATRVRQKFRSHIRIESLEEKKVERNRCSIFFFIGLPTLLLIEATYSTSNQRKQKWLLIFETTAKFQQLYSA